MNSQSSKWIGRLARYGFAAKGAVYIIIGVLAAQAAFNIGGELTDSSGALLTIAVQPQGTILLSLVAIGLTGYALWRFVQAILDPEHLTTGVASVLQRMGCGISGLAYTGLAFTAVELICGSRGSGNNTTQIWIARLLVQSYGQWLVGTVGAVTIGLGFLHVYRALSAEFHKRLRLIEMSRGTQTWITQIGRFGLIARGVVFMLVGHFLIQAAYYSDPSRAQLTEGALRTLDRQPNPWLLGVVALGLVAYGIHMGVLARYRRINL